MGWEAGGLSEVTVLFADCRDYTSLTRELGVEKIAPVMEEFFRTASQIVIGRDGIVDHFLGDAVMAFFNVPIQRADHVAQAIAASAEIQLGVPHINATSGGAEILRVGIGIATGWCLVTSAGSTKCGDYTVVGDTVNVASRLQGQAAPGEIIVTEATYQAIQSAFPNAKRRQYELKGISEQVVGYVLT